MKSIHLIVKQKLWHLGRNVDDSSVSHENKWFAGEILLLKKITKSTSFSSLTRHRNGVIKWSKHFKKKLLYLALAGFHASPLSWWTGIWSDSFCWGRKTREPGEKPLEQDDNLQQTEPKYGTRPISNPGHITLRQCFGTTQACCWWFHFNKRVDCGKLSYFFNWLTPFQTSLDLVPCKA